MISEVMLFVAHKLEAKCIGGVYGEMLPLCVPLEAGLKTCNWMSLLEQTMKSTVNSTLEACVQARLEDGK